MSKAGVVLEILKMLEEFDTLISMKRLLKGSIKDTDEKIVDLVSKCSELIGQDLEKFATLDYGAFKAFNYKLRKLMTDEEYNELIELVLPKNSEYNKLIELILLKDSKFFKIQTQDKVYYEEYKKAADVAWVLADYLIDNPQNYMEYPWTLIPGPVRESIEYIVNRKKTARAGFSHKSIPVIPLDMVAIQTEKDLMKQQLEENFEFRDDKKLQKSLDYHYEKILKTKRKLEKKPESND